LYNKITVRQMHREFRLQAVIHSFIHTRLINTVTVYFSAPPTVSPMAHSTVNGKYMPI